MNCICCNQPLTGNLDTFGYVGEEMCQACWLDVVDSTATARRQASPGEIGHWLYRQYWLMERQKYIILKGILEAQAKGVR